MSDENARQLIAETETWTKSTLEEFPHDGICIHTLEQSDQLKLALNGDPNALEYVRDRFDLGLMAAKTEQNIHDDKIVDNLHKLNRIAEKL